MRAATASIVPIVEGHGETEAVPALLHRIALICAPHVRVQVNPPIRVKCGSFLKFEDYFRKQVLLAGAKAAQAQGIVLVLLDSEDRCPEELGPELLRRVRAVRGDVPVIVSLAYREYETWFVAAVGSLRGCRGIGDDVSPPPDPESIRDAKGWLGKRMDGPYDPVVHQLEFTRAFDLVEARAVPSFDRLSRRVCDWLKTRDIDR